MNINTNKIDKIGTIASLGCAIHCACLPVLISVLPAIVGSFLASPTVEWALFVTSLLLGTFSVVMGYRKHHKLSSLAMMVLGLVVLLCGRLLHETSWHDLGIIALVSGGILVALAHMMNHHLCRCHKESEIQLTKEM